MTTNPTRRIAFGLTALAEVVSMVSLAADASRASCTIYKPADIARARQNIAQHAWARDVYGGIKSRTTRYLGMDRDRLRGFIPEQTPLITVTCPNCGNGPWYAYDLVDDGNALCCKACQARWEYDPDDDSEAWNVQAVLRTLRLTDVVNLQASTSYFGFLPGWFVFTQPVACIVFIVSVFAETNRLPFDLPEAEQELVAGYHSEYSSMKFAMFFMAEYAHMITASALIASLFFGGWHLPGLDPADDSLGVSLLKVLVFAVKTVFFLFVFIWVRWTVPRFRYDQVMRLGWKYLLPIALANVFVTGLVLTLTR